MESMSTTEARKIDRSPKGPEIRREAERRFLEARGRISLSALARELSTSRQTLTRWRREDRWEQRLTLVRQAIDEKMVESVASIMEERVSKMIEEDLAFFSTTDKLLFKMLFAQDSEGRILCELDDQGVSRPMLNMALTPHEIKALISARAEKIKAVRLMLGLSTQNIDSDVNHGGAVAYSPPGGAAEEAAFLQWVAEIGEDKAQRMLDVLLGEDE